MDYTWIMDSLPQRRPPDNATYHIRIYQENDKLRLEALKKAPADLSKYEVRECNIYQSFNLNQRTIKFYLDNVWLAASAIHKIASQISEIISNTETERLDTGSLQQFSRKIMRIYPTYHVRIYKENDKLRFEALKRPLFAYADRTYMLSKKGNARRLVFYLDDVWVNYETTYKIAQQIYDAMGW
jgi:hypothetical protein